jgi:hypothetical protein
MLCFGLQEDQAVMVTIEKDTSSNRAGFGMMRTDEVDAHALTDDIGSESESARQIREAKAVKADDAEVPVHLWNSRIIVPGLAELDSVGLASHFSTIRERFLL